MAKRKCEKHPHYRGIRAPRSKDADGNLCSDCLGIYQAMKDSGYKETKVRRKKCENPDLVDENMGAVEEKFVAVVQEELGEDRETAEAMSEELNEAVNEVLENEDSDVEDSDVKDTDSDDGDTDDSDGEDSECVCDDDEDEVDDWDFEEEEEDEEFDFDEDDEEVYE
jgi:hypothetical protein